MVAATGISWYPDTPLGKTGFDYAVRVHAWRGSPQIKVVATAVQFLGTKEKEDATAGAATPAAATPDDDDIPF